MAHCDGIKAHDGAHKRVGHYAHPDLTGGHQGWTELVEYLTSWLHDDTHCRTA